MDFHNKVIPYFPIGRPDELLYSICATFQDHMRFPKHHYVMETLFGYKLAHVTYDLPNRLEYLVNNLPPGCNYTVDELIDNHTMLPLYSPFCPQERIQRARQAMHQSGKVGSTIHSRLGILFKERLKFLRFCPLCVKEDIALFNEPYWHRVHQAPGVEICPIHAVFLETSYVPARNSLKHYSLVSAREGTFERSPCFLESDNRNHSILLQIARDVDWILNRGNSTSNLEQIHKRYKNILASKGLATHRGTVSHRGELINQFLNFYPSEILEKLNCEISTTTECPWLVKLPQSRTQQSQPVIHHLLFIQFLSYTVEEFLQLPYELKPFGEGPWPCLNPICENFQQMCIQECLTSYSRQSGRRPVGKFQCVCGFIYSRLGPDSDNEAKFHFSRVERYGVVWETALKTFWADPNVSLHEMARKLGIKHKTVKYHADQLNLPLPRQANRPVGICSETIRWRSQLPKPKIDRLKLYREEWLLVRKDYPTAKLYELRKLAPRAYEWLVNNDAKWFGEHYPPSIRVITPPASNRINWSERDVIWSKAILEATHLLLNSSNCPRQITMSMLGREIGELSKISKNLDKLPLTAQVLAEVVETSEQAAVRRVYWVTECYRQANVCPTQTQFEVRASINPKLRQSEQVQEAISKGLLTLSLISTGISSTT